MHTFSTLNFTFILIHSQPSEVDWIKQIQKVKCQAHFFNHFCCFAQICQGWAAFGKFWAKLYSKQVTLTAGFILRGFAFSLVLKFNHKCQIVRHIHNFGLLEAELILDGRADFSCQNAFSLVGQDSQTGWVMFDILDSGTIQSGGEIWIYTSPVIENIISHTKRKQKGT